MVIYIAEFIYSEQNVDFFSSMFVGGFAIFDIIFVIGSILTLFLTKDYFYRTYNTYKELYTIIISSVFGMMYCAF